MFTLTVIDKFSSAHKLVNHEGKCKNLHGHTYKVEVDVMRPELDSNNMVMDFAVIKDALHAAVLILDHNYINDVLEEDNPTAEYLAKWFHQALSPAFSVSNVRIWESDTAYATYRRYR